MAGGERGGVGVDHDPDETLMSDDEPGVAGGECDGVGGGDPDETLMDDGERGAAICEVNLAAGNKQTRSNHFSEEQSDQ